MQNTYIIAKQNKAKYNLEISKECIDGAIAKLNNLLFVNVNNLESLVEDYEYSHQVVLIEDKESLREFEIAVLDVMNRWNDMIKPKINSAQ